MNGGLPVVETSQEGVRPVVPPGGAGHVVPMHFGRQHSWVASGKCTGESPPLQPVPDLPGFAQWFPPGEGGPGGGGGAGPPHSKPQIPLAHFPPVGQSALDVHPSVQSVGGGLPVLETSQTGFPLTPAPGAGQVVPVQAGRHTHIPCRRPTKEFSKRAIQKPLETRVGLSVSQRLRQGASFSTKQPNKGRSRRPDRRRDRTQQRTHRHFPCHLTRCAPRCRVAVRGRSRLVHRIGKGGDGVWEGGHCQAEHHLHHRSHSRGSTEGAGGGSWGALRTH
eukprot:COSAG02_NODE_524_length_20723_cov_79.399438_16_plen_277_part_00